MNTALKQPADPRLTSPRYVRVYTTLRDWINSGKYGPGDKIPTEDEIGQLFSVSRITTRKAIDLLVEDELVQRIHGRGTFVAANVRERAGIETMFQRTRKARGIATRSRLSGVEVAEVGADAHVAIDLKVPVGRPVTRISYVRMFQANPVAWVEIHVPAGKAAIKANDIGTRSVLALLERQGITITDAEQLISATLADPFLAGKLGCSVGVPLLAIKQVAMDADHKPAQRFACWFLGDQYEHPAHVSDRALLEFVQGVIEPGQV